jgi:IS5 family transposase
MIESVVRRAKRLALKRFIQTGVKGIKLDDLLRRCGRSPRKTRTCRAVLLADAPHRRNSRSNQPLRCDVVRARVKDGAGHEFSRTATAIPVKENRHESEQHHRT